MKMMTTTVWDVETLSDVLQQVPSLKFIWSLQYMLSRIWTSQARASLPRCKPSAMSRVYPWASRRDDDHIWTELYILQNDIQHVLTDQSFHRTGNLEIVRSKSYCKKLDAAIKRTYSFSNVARLYLSIWALVIIERLMESFDSTTGSAKNNIEQF